MSQLFAGGLPPAAENIVKKVKPKQEGFGLNNSHNNTDFRIQRLHVDLRTLCRFHTVTVFIC